MSGRVEWLCGATFAHRGLHGGGLHGGGRVENSRSAFVAAVERSLGIECDVQLTADGEAVVFHDFTLERLTGASGPVRARTAAELAGLALGQSGDTILRLSGVLALIAGRVPLLIEVKMRRDWPVAPLCEAVARALAGYGGAHAAMSFDPRVPRWFARYAPATPRGLVMSTGDTPGLFGPLRRRAALWLARPDFLALDIRDLPGRFAAAQRARGLKIATWTVRDSALLIRARAYADAAIAEGAGVPPDSPGAS